MKNKNQILAAMALFLSVTALPACANAQNQQTATPSCCTEETCVQEFKVGDNLVEVLSSAKDVTYEFNIDSGIWAQVGEKNIIIDFDQLNEKGIEFVNSIPSDIAPNVDFKVEYLVPDAKILAIE